MSSSEITKNQISLTLVVDKEKHKVQYAEAGKDLVDILLSFLTLPLGSVSRVVSEKSTSQQPCRFNSITSLRQTVEKLHPKYFSANGDKEMLLNPRSPMDEYIQNTPFSEGFNGYVLENTCYIVSDDLRVMPHNIGTTLWMLRNFGVESVTERLTLSLSKNEVPDLLKFSLCSKRPLTDLFLSKKLQIQDSETFQLLPKVKINEGQGKVGIRIKLKVLVSKSEGKVVLGEAEEGFMDQLLSFLTIPVAAVERLEQGNSGLGCIDNSYKSSSDLDSNGFFDSSICLPKSTLLNPLVAPAKVRNQLLPIYVAGTSSWNTGGYVKWGRKFMVKDDLSVEPFSSPSALSCLVESKVAEQDLQEMELSIGVNEVFGILKAAMFSTSALTIGLRPLLTVVN